MASRTKKTDTPPVAETAADWLEQDEDGFEAVNPDLHYYAMEIEGKMNPLRGVVLDRRERRDGSGRFYYVLGLTRPCRLKNMNDTSDVIDASPGTYAWVDENWALQPLQDFLPLTRDGAMVAVHEVIVIPKGKRDIGGGKSVWRAEIKARRVEPTPGMPLLAPKSASPPVLSSGEQEEIPF